MLDQLERERERCARIGLTMAFLGVGCESREAAKDPRTRSVVGRADRICARDAFSPEVLASSAQPGALVLGADLAHVPLGAHEAGFQPEPMIPPSGPPAAGRRSQRGGRDEAVHDRRVDRGKLGARRRVVAELAAQHLALHPRHQSVDVDVGVVRIKHGSRTRGGS